LFVRPVDDLRRQVERRLTSHGAREQAFQNLMVDGSEILPDIALQHVRATPRAFLRAIQRPVRPESLAAGERILAESFLKDRLHDTCERMMDHSVPKRRG